MLMEEIKPTIFMFLTNIKEVKVKYRDRARILRWRILRAFERDGITVMRVWASDEIDGRPPMNYAFQVFRHEVDVPKEVREDEITRKARRNNARKREVAIAFQVDEAKSSLVPVEAGLQFLYSFLPLTEVRTGLKFLIHGDFIVQAGRRTLNPEAKWNEWMVREIANLLNRAIDYLAEEYAGSYLNVIEYERRILEPAMDRLLTPIYEVLGKKKSNPIAKCISCGRLVHVDEAVALTRCAEEFVKSYGNFEELEKRIGKHIISSEDDRRLHQHGIYVKSIKCEDLVNINYVSTDDLPKLYRVAYKLWEGFERVTVKVKALDGSVKAASEVRYVPNKLRSIVETLRDKVPSVFEKIKGYLIHDEFMNQLGSSDDERVEVLKRLGVKEFTCGNALDKDLLLAIKDTSLEALIQYIILIYKNCGTEVPGENRFVVSSRGELLRARETHYSEFPLEVVNLLNDQRLGKYIRKYLDQLKIIHEDLRKGLGDELLEKLGVRRIEYCDILNELFNKVLLTRDKVPDPDEVVALTTLVIKNYNKCLGPLMSDIWVLAMDGSVRKSSKVYWPTQDCLFDELRDKFIDISRYPYCNEDMKLCEDFFRKFTLIGYHGYESLVEDVIKLMERSDISRERLIKLTCCLKRIYEKSPSVVRKYRDHILVLRDDGQIGRATSCYMHDDYEPAQKWYRWKASGFTNIGPFISNEYLSICGTREDWRKFFQGIGVREEVISNEVIASFALWYVENKLRSAGFEVYRTCEGCDIRAVKGSDEYFIEVKGRSGEAGIELTRNEFEAIQRYGNKYWLIVVMGIPNNVKVYVIEKPHELIKEELPSTIGIRPQLIIRHGKDLEEILRQIKQ
ncbi:hypothetical protein TUZN_1702 [Thermoproteus uzoniensis 768-20]|uniref:Protein NO VEIN C-terminal domain-containing protein n=2 Tax=Thermoproteus TaxID=2270 RepID=F2L348_THEU7|nr:hypothetical protein TUZN_1702 [Thermoproteus uzoniensis 768-20]